VPQVALATLFWTFLRIGATAFGGFMALIAVVQTTVVQQRKWLSHEEVLDGVSLAQILPGPMAVNVVSYIGYRLRGGLGAVVSATAVILPAFLLMLLLSWLYLRFGEIPAVKNAFAGFIPAVAAIIFSTAWNMTAKALPDWRAWLLAVAGAGLLLGVGGFYLTLAIVLGSGVIGALLFRGATQPGAATNTPLFGIYFWLGIGVLLGVFLSFALWPPHAGQTGLGHLARVFGGMSVMLFGGGFVFIPLIQEVVVETLGWVDQPAFTTAIALGQITPGPILISATFIGFAVQGVVGAGVATVAIFFPPALLMILSAHLLAHLKRWQVMQAALKGIRAAVVGMIVAAGVIILQSADLLHWLSWGIFALTLLALLRFKLDVVWIIPIAGIVGLLLYR
jgi:chromate transporter